MGPTTFNKKYTLWDFLELFSEQVERFSVLVFVKALFNCFVFNGNYF